MPRLGVTLWYFRSIISSIPSCVRLCRSRDLVADDVEGMLFRKRLEGSEKGRTGKGKELGKDVVSEKSSLCPTHEVRALEYKAHCRTVLILVKKLALYASISGSEGTDTPNVGHNFLEEATLDKQRAVLQRKGANSKTLAASSSAASMGRTGENWQGC